MSCVAFRPRLVALLALATSTQHPQYAMTHLWMQQAPVTVTIYVFPSMFVTSYSYRRQVSLSMTSNETLCERSGIVLATHTFYHLPTIRREGLGGTSNECRFLPRHFSISKMAPPHCPQKGLRRPVAIAGAIPCLIAAGKMSGLHSLICLSATSLASFKHLQ